MIVDEIGFKRLRDYRPLCLKATRVNPRDPAYRRHAHVCNLEHNHPVSERTGVQLHECGRGSCTIAWESDPRPPKDTRGYLGTAHG